MDDDNALVIIVKIFGYRAKSKNRLLPILIRNSLKFSHILIPVQHVLNKCLKHLNLQDQVDRFTLIRDQDTQEYLHEYCLPGNKYGN